jgi:hypothetical protein
LAVEEVITVYSFRPVASQLKNFQHDDAKEEQLRDRAPAKRQILTFNRHSILYTFFTITEPQQCVEVDIRHHQIAHIALDKPSPWHGRGVPEGSWRLELILKEPPPLQASDTSSIVSPGSGNSGGLEFWFGPSDARRMQRDLEAERTRLRTLVSTVPDLIWLMISLIPLQPL